MRRIALNPDALRVESFAIEPYDVHAGTIHAMRMEEGVSEQTCSCVLTCAASCAARETCAGASCEVTRCPVVLTCYIPIADVVEA